VLYLKGRHTSQKRSEKFPEKRAIEGKVERSSLSTPGTWVLSEEKDLRERGRKEKTDTKGWLPLRSGRGGVSGTGKRFRPQKKKTHQHRGTQSRSTAAKTSQNSMVSGGGEKREGNFRRGSEEESVTGRAKKIPL